MSDLVIGSLWVEKDNEKTFGILSFFDKKTGIVLLEMFSDGARYSDSFYKHDFIERFISIDSMVQQFKTISPKDTLTDGNNEMPEPKAVQILKEAVEIMAERGKSYDKAGSGSERSMNKIVDMFFALTGIRLTPSQGYKFMTCLKLGRSEQGEHKDDNYLDGAAYMALAGEAAAQEVGKL